MFFIIFIIVILYFVFMSIAVSHMDNKKDLPKVAVSVLLIYGCVVGMFAAVGQHLGGIGLALYILALVYSIFFLLWGIHGLFNLRTRIHRSVLIIFVSYLLAVLYITFFMRESGTNNRIQMEVFNWMNEGEIETFEHMFLNIAMFVPIGVIFPFITEGLYRKIILSVSVGILFSTAIETGQLLFRSGTCDIDDILSNSLGAWIGAVIGVGGMWIGQKSKKNDK